MTMTRGNHSLKVGGEVSYEHIVHDTLLDNYGVFSFNASKTGNAYADFLLGLPATMTQDAPIRKIDSGAYFSVFAQDDFRIHPRVTLNLGIRYDLQQPLTDPQDRKLAFVPGRKSTGVAECARGTALPGRRRHQPRHREVGPQQHRAARRPGVGSERRRSPVRSRGRRHLLRQHHAATSGTRRQTTSRSRFASSFRRCSRYPIRTATSQAASGRSPSSTTRRARSSRCPATVFGPSLEFVWPKTYQMNVTVEKELFRNVSASASYVGALGRNLPASIDRNYPVFESSATTTNFNTRRPYQPGVLGRGARARVDLHERLSRPAAGGGKARQPLLGQGVLLVQAKRSRISTIRAAVCRPCRTRTI